MVIPSRTAEKKDDDKANIDTKFDDPRQKDEEEEEEGDVWPRWETKKSNYPNFGAVGFRRLVREPPRVNFLRRSNRGTKLS